MGGGGGRRWGEVGGGGRRWGMEVRDYLQMQEWNAQKLVEVH